MAFWWVNQNQTYEQEIGGGYMWSPKRNANGAYNQFYENMTLAQPGDVVFSFRQQHISDVGIVQAPAQSAPKPQEFGESGSYWSAEGWLVSVSWHKLGRPVRPKQYIDELRPTLPPKYSPLNAQTGSGLQSVYLANVKEDMAAVLVSKLSAKDQAFIANAGSSVSADDEAIAALEDDIEKRIEQDTTIDVTERQTIINARKGQGKYRRNLELIEQACRVTGVTDKRLLRASHIKPWRLCDTNHERLDGNNGLLLSPNIDHLFDQGFISFESDGKLLASSLIETDQLVALGVPLSETFRTGPFNEEQRDYLSFHRHTVFKP